MTWQGWLQIGLVLALVVATIKPLGLYMARVFGGERTLFSPMFGPIERGFYRLAGLDPEGEQTWLGYAVGVLLFSFFGVVLLFAILRLQGLLPLNPQGFEGLAPDLAFNTAVSL
ncbi:hypothetical protein GCM10007989_27080 [Devosia pacifica]|uniref:Potassium-transporting ATPase subunit KdpA n=1 Tax=Devosia pacifica TaxID=1335967 RepID=A0A918VWJ4_9HYPH|nr:hypothetical protein GCM10007989_27080 [Devosia pacifica]